MAALFASTDSNSFAHFLKKILAHQLSFLIPKGYKQRNSGFFLVINCMTYGTGYFFCVYELFSDPISKKCSKINTLQQFIYILFFVLQNHFDIVTKLFDTKIYGTMLFTFVGWGEESIWKYSILLFFIFVRYWKTYIAGNFLSQTYRKYVFSFN